LLVVFVALADQYGHKLTLEFQPQWAEYALTHPNALAQLRSWEANGHEIAVHHHGVSHPAWDGYTNAPGYQNRPEYRGTMENAMALLNQLTANGPPLTGDMTDEETNWPPTLIYATGGLGMQGGSLTSTPTTVTYHGVTATQVSNRSFVLDKGLDATLEELQAAVQAAAPGKIVGIVTHPTTSGPTRPKWKPCSPGWRRFASQPKPFRGSWKGGDESLRPRSNGWADPAAGCVTPLHPARQHRRLCEPGARFAGLTGPQSLFSRPTADVSSTEVTHLAAKTKRGVIASALRARSNPHGGAGDRSSGLRPPRDDTFVCELRMSCHQYIGL